MGGFGGKLGGIDIDKKSGFLLGLISLQLPTISFFIAYNLYFSVLSDRTSFPFYRAVCP